MNTRTATLLANIQHQTRLALRDAEMAKQPEQTRVGFDKHGNEYNAWNPQRRTAKRLPKSPACGAAITKAEGIK